jgi:hypothetical protein
LLVLVFSLAVCVANLADFVGLEEENLAQAFIGVDARGQRRCVGDLEGDEAFPFGFEGGDVDDDAAAGVGRFSDADGEDIARDFEVLDGAGERERVGRNDDAGSLDGDEGALELTLVKILNSSETRRS